MFGIDDAIIGTVGAGLVNNLFASNRQEEAQAFSAQQYATRYQTQVKDLEAAGLNPMLAYTQGPGSAPTSSAASATGMGDVGQTINQSKMTSAQVANIAADTENKKAQADLIEAQAMHYRASAGNLTAGIQQIEANVDKIREEIKNIPDEGKRLRQAAQMLSQQSTLMAQQGASEQERQAVLKATAAKLRVENLITQEDYKAIIQTGGVGRIAREVKPASDIVSDWLSPSKWFTNKTESIIRKGK